MILYPILAKISISYLYLSWPFLHSCTNQSQRVFWCNYAILLVIYAVFYTLWCMDQSIYPFFGKYHNVSCSKISELLGHTFLTLHRINCQGTCFSIYSICKIFWRYPDSKKDMDIDMIWYNISMVLWDRGYDIISQQLARYEIWYYILEFGIFPTTGIMC